MAILSKYTSVQKASAPACLVIVPHRDLAVQLYRWGQELCPSTSVKTPIQLIARGLSGMAVEDHVSLLVSSPPRLVIGTVGGLLDVLEDESALRQLCKVKTIVVEEVDRLLDLPRKYASRAEWKKFNRHPAQLTTLFAKLAGAATQRNGGEETKPQLVMSSATMPSRLRGYIYTHSASLFRRGEAHQVNLVARDEKPSVPSSIDHYAIVVFPDGNTVDLGQYQDAGLEEKADGSETTTGLTRAPFEGHAMPWYILECMARVFKEEGIQRALVVVKAESPIKKIVEGLRRLGVQAELLDNLGTETLADKEGGEDIDGARMVVCSEASVHGIDIRSLTHVFVVGAASSAALYRHIAGRVGRLGQDGRGTVTSFLEGEGERGARERARMGRIVRQLGI